MPSNPTHYDVLNVSRHAPPEVIAAAYKAMSRLHHPDLNRNAPDATKRMADINASYQILSDTVRRQEYDRKLAQMATRPQPPIVTPRPPIYPAAAYRPRQIETGHSKMIAMVAMCLAFILYDNIFIRQTPACNTPLPVMVYQKDSLLQPSLRPAACPASQNVIARQPQRFAPASASFNSAGFAKLF